MDEDVIDGATEEYDALDLPEEIDLDAPYENAEEDEDPQDQHAEDAEEGYQEQEEDDGYASQTVTSIPPDIFTEQEREQLEELMITDPVRANVILTQRIIQREMASNAILNQSLAPIAAKAPKLVNAYGAQVQQAAALLTAEAKSNPRQAEAMTWGMVISNEIAQHGVVEAIRKVSKLIDEKTEVRPKQQAERAQQPQQQPKQKIAPSQRVATGIQTKASTTQPYTRRQAANNALAEIFGVDPTVIAGI
jgi:hypothetical protein